MLVDVFNRLKAGEEVQFQLSTDYFDRTLYTVQFDPEPDSFMALVWWRNGPEKTQTDYDKNSVLGLFGSRQWVAV